MQKSTTEEAPWLGRCTEVGDDTLGVIWMEGGWKKPRKKVKLRQGFKRAGEVKGQNFQRH